MVDGYLGTLTTEERALLHLINQQLPSGGWEAPAVLTQAGISAAVHVQRKHIPRTLKRMERKTVCWTLLNGTSPEVNNVNACTPLQKSAVNKPMLSANASWMSQ